jgi:hypothetical protein
MTSNTAWAEYQNDFDAMTDKEVNEETRRSQSEVVWAESWLEAVAAWEAAGRPRTKKEAQP